MLAVRIEGVNQAERKIARIVRQHFSNRLACSRKTVGARLRSKLAQALKPLKAQAYFPPLALCTDNGAMIAFAAAERVKQGLATLEKGSHAFTVRPRWDLAEISEA